MLGFVLKIESSLHLFLYCIDHLITCLNVFLHYKVVQEVISFDAKQYESYNVPPFLDPFYHLFCLYKRGMFMVRQWVGWSGKKIVPLYFLSLLLQFNDNEWVSFKSAKVWIVSPVTKTSLNCTNMLEIFHFLLLNCAGIQLKLNYSIDAYLFLHWTKILKHYNLITWLF